MNYTPGPWSIRYPSGINMDIISENRKICSFSGLSHSVELMDEQEEEEQANANLISAAPDLLEALELLVRRVEDTDSEHNFPSAYQSACDAIKKAKGTR